MQFLDHVTIQIESGAGGNGVVAWRREKYEPEGGPAGGDGGHGGDLSLEATDALNTLLEFKYKALFKAEDGVNGSNKKKHGRMGKELILKVPCGTIVRDAETGKVIADLTNPGDQVMVASGGRGGRGNARFANSARQVPQFCEPGEAGIARTLALELKLIADVGIIGLPNAGKSTLISVISSAKPKIADYPFTTLVPNLGVVRQESGMGVVLADIPGLIEGASHGSGLGHEFLRHVERTRLLLHLVDITVDTFEMDSTLDETALALADFKLINDELAHYSQALAQKPQMVLLTKTDALSPETVQAHVNAFQAVLPTGSQVYPLSSVTRQGIEAFLSDLFKALEALPPKNMDMIPVAPDPKAMDHDDSHFEITRADQGAVRIFQISGGKVERLFSVMDACKQASVFRTLNILKSMGVYKALAKAGASEGDEIVIGGQSFEYEETPQFD